MFFKITDLWCLTKIIFEKKKNHVFSQFFVGITKRLAFLKTFFFLVNHVVTIKFSDDFCLDFCQKFLKTDS